MQTSMFPAFHTRTVCFGPFLKVLTPSLFLSLILSLIFQNILTWEEGVDKKWMQRKIMLIVRTPSSSGWFFSKGCWRFRVPRSSRLSLLHLAACLWREWPNDGWEKRDTEKRWWVDLHTPKTNLQENSKMDGDSINSTHQCWPLVLQWMGES